MRTFSRFLFALIFLGIAYQGITKDKGPAWYAAYPSANEVADWYEENIDQTPEKYQYYRLIKNPNGYFIVTYGYTDDLEMQDLHDPVQVWSSQKQKFIHPKNDHLTALGNPKLVGEENKALKTMLRSADHTDANIFFGYDGWAEDVIRELENNARKDARMWYGLGRAYSNLATEIMHVPESSNQPHPFDLNLDPVFFTESMLDRYEELIRKSILAFDKTAELNPLLEITVGYPVIKSANEYMTAWMNLKVIGQNERAARYIRPGIYPPVLISYATNLLLSCEPNAILFANGDNDTFPLWYLQQMQGFRTDVTVVNLNLINLARHIHYYKTMLPEAGRLPIALAREAYQGDANELYLMDPDHIVALPAPPASFPRLEGDVLQQSLTIPFRPGYGDYLLKQDMILLNVINENAWKRPLYFTGGVASSNKLGLDPMCRIVGFCAQITPFRFATPKPKMDDGYGSSEGIFPPDPNFDLLVNQFVYNGLQDPSGKPGELPLPAMQGLCRLRFHKLLESLYMADDTDRFGKALRRYLEIYPLLPTARIPGFFPVDAFYAAEFGFAAEAQQMLDASEAQVEIVLGKIKRKENLSFDELRNGYFIQQCLTYTYNMLKREDDFDRINKVQILFQEQYEKY